MNSNQNIERMRTNPNYKENFIKGVYNTLYYNEVLDMVDALEPHERVEAMRNNASIGLMTVLFYVYDKEQIHFDLKPEDIAKIDHRPSIDHSADPDMAERTLKSQYTSLKVLVGPQKRKTKIKFLSGWFETMPAGEVEILKLMFNRTLEAKYPWMTEDFVRQCYPNLLTKKS